MIRRLINKASLLVSELRSIYLNFKYLPLATAKKLPILIHWSVKVDIVGSQIMFDSIPKKFIFQYGIDQGVDISENKTSYFILKNSSLNLSGRYPTKIRRGGTISGQNTKISIGGNFFANSNFYLKSQKEMHIGRNVMLGYDVSMRDSDGHEFQKTKPSTRSLWTQQV
ncbi:hypothetical protein R5R49_08745 [Oenococcus oeni]